MRRIKLFFTCLLCACSLAAQPPTAVTSDSLLLHYFDSLQVPISHDNRVVLLETGQAKFDDMFQAIRQAKHYVHLEYFNFRNDSIANALFDVLAERASHGVKVRALFDGWGNDSNNKPLRKKQLKALRSRGIEIYEFDPVRFPYLNHAVSRDHRKIVVIDGEVAYTGGMNVADYYIHGKEIFGKWRDMHMRIEGGAVAHLQRIFLMMWQKTTHQHLDEKMYMPGVYTDTHPSHGLPIDTSLTAGHKTVAVVNRIPHISPKMARQAYIGALDCAQKKVQIVNPYFTLTPSVYKAIKRVIARGVPVEIMVSEKCDVPVTPTAVIERINSLVKKGATVYYYQDGFHHSKVMMVDSAFCTVGSINLNSRSLRYDHEVNCFIFDASTTGQLMKLFKEDEKKSVPFTHEMYMKRSWNKRLWGKMCRLLIPFL